MIFACAHVRGGGEMGKHWHDEGRMLHKKNTFTDFIACAEHLIREHYTEPSRLVIQGGSAGGLLMGAVTNLRPELVPRGCRGGALRGRGQHHAGCDRCR